MRKLISMLVFSVTLFAGVIFSPIKTPTIYEKIYPHFSRIEAESLLGRRVTNKAETEGLLDYGVKYPLNAEKNFTSEKVEIGETGQIIALQEINHGFVLFIKWDKQNQFGREMFSYHRRHSSRMLLKFE